MKALGTGHTQGVLWRDVEVVRRGGPPQLQFHGGAARRFALMGAQSSLLTITHSDRLALAEVLILAAVVTQPPVVIFGAVGRARPAPTPRASLPRRSQPLQPSLTSPTGTRLRHRA